jgi:isocitrate lyase
MTTNAAEQLRKEWQDNPRWQGVQRPYSAEDVVRLRGSVHIEHSLARLGAEKLWKYVHEKPFDGQPGHAASQGWPGCNLLVGLAGRR